jgi:hypothetical protein
MEGEIHTYQTDSDDENVENDLHTDPQRKRGIALERDDNEQKTKSVNRLGQELN